MIHADFSGLEVSVSSATYYLDDLGWVISPFWDSVFSFEKIRELDQILFEVPTRSSPRRNGSLILCRLSINGWDKLCSNRNSEHEGEMVDDWLSTADTSERPAELPQTSQPALPAQPSPSPRAKVCAPHWPFKANDFSQEELHGLGVVSVATQCLQEVTESLDLLLRPPGGFLLCYLNGFWRKITLWRESQSDTQDPAVSSLGRWAIPTPALSHFSHNSGWHVVGAYCVPCTRIPILYTSSYWIRAQGTRHDCYSHLTGEHTQAGLEPRSATRHGLYCRLLNIMSLPFINCPPCSTQHGLPQHMRTTVRGDLSGFSL